MNTFVFMILPIEFANDDFDFFKMFLSTTAIFIELMILSLFKTLKTKLI